MGEGVLDFSLDSIPVISSGKSLYELIQGKNLVTGERLSELDRGIVFVGVFAGFVGLGNSKTIITKSKSIIASIWKRISPVSKLALDNGSKILYSARKLGVKTGEGIKDFADLSKRIVGNEIGAVGDLSKVIKGKMTRYGPLKSGPLHKVKIGTETVADTFRSSSYFETVLDEPLKVYRVYGGEAGELGSYWSRIKPTGQATFDAALLPSFRNSAQNVSITIRKIERVKPSNALTADLKNMQIRMQV